MDIESIRQYCLNKPGFSEDFPFDESTLVFRVGGKMFALMGIAHFEFINLKCDPEKASILREAHEEIKPGYHMNKKHWNSVYVNGRLSNSFIMEQIDHSYDLVYMSLPKKIRDGLRA